MENPADMERMEMPVRMSHRVENMDAASSLRGVEEDMASLWLCEVAMNEKDFIAETGWSHNNKKRYKKNPRRRRRSNKRYTFRTNRTLPTKKRPTKIFLVRVGTK
jgi:hypothetical protein